MKIGVGNNEDTLSCNRSTTTSGAGLASKIGQTMSRILLESNLDQSQDDIGELMALIDELNAHHDLKQKLSSQSKILRFLNDAGDNKDLKEKNAPVVKDYKREITKAKSEFGKLGFQSKLRLEMKNLMIEPKAKEIVDASRKKLESLQNERDEEIEDFQEEHAEAKYKALQKIKSKFKVQIAIANKAKDEVKKGELEEKQKEEVKKIEKEMQQKSLEAKTKIKERFNEMAQKVTIDAREFVLALLAKKDTSKLVVLDKSSVNMNSGHSPKDDDDPDQQPSIDNIAINFEQPELSKQVKSEQVVNISTSSIKGAVTDKKEKSPVKIDIDLTKPLLVDLEVSKSVSP